MKEEIQLLQHNGKEIILFDFSNCKKEDIKPIIEEAMQWFQDKPLNSVLTLTDVTNARFDTEILNLLKEFVLHNKPYVKAGAVVGVTRPITKAIYLLIMSFAKRYLPLFDTRKQAMDWLSNQ